VRGTAALTRPADGSTGESDGPDGGGRSAVPPSSWGTLSEPYRDGWSVRACRRRRPRARDTPGQRPFSGL